MAVEKKPNVSIYLDKRRVKNNGKYPVKLRVYFLNDQRRLYPLPVECTEDAFEKSYLSPKPKAEYRTLSIKLRSYETAAIELIESMDNFNFDNFKKKFFRGRNDSSNIIYHYKQYLNQLESEGKVNTKDNYQQSLNSILLFANTGQKKAIDYLGFDSVTPEFLKSYERYMLTSGKSLTTVGIYLRPLRAIFNSAIEIKDIPEDLYPFGKRKYQIPGGSKVKKSLSKDMLSTLYNYKVEPGSHFEKARDFFFLSYQCNGMNVADICLIKNKDINDGILTFIRKKTLNTTKESSKPIIVPLTQWAIELIEKYRQGNRNPNEYVFSVLLSISNEEEKVKKIKAFTRYINQHLKELARLAGITTKVSTNWGRHSFTTNAVRGGAKMEYIQDSLGHQSMQTTMNYWSGFEDNVKLDVNNKLIDFAE